MMLRSVRPTPALSNIRVTSRTVSVWFSFRAEVVFGNVGTLVAFRIGYWDAETLEKEFGRTFPASAFSDLERYEIVVKL